MKDHGGELELFNAPDGGACVSMSFLREPANKGTEA
jgi:Signal transduction histidine kinase involved in nitrogen fixation and metabolism regulation